MFDYFGVSVAFIVVQYAIELYINLRQYRCYNVKEVPKYKDLENIITPESFLKSQSYRADLMKFSMVKDAVMLLETLLSLKLGIMPWIWATFGAGFGETLHSLVFVAINYLIRYLISLPFNLYATFHIEQHYGFNKQNLKMYVEDQLKTLVLCVIIGAPLLAAVVAVIRRTGPLFWFWLWCIIVAFNLTFVVVYPTYIMPMFNKFTPLAEGPLRHGVEAAATEVGFSLTQIYVIDGSKRSGHSNAFFVGFGKHKRIVLYDTLINQLNKDEVLAILAHELSHWRHNHTYKLAAISLLHMLFCFAVFGRFVNDGALYESFGFGAAKMCGSAGDAELVCTYPCIIGLSLFMMVYEPVNSIFTFFTNGLTRRFEYQADAGATRMGFDLSIPLVKVSKENLSTLVIDPVYSAYNYDHPTLLERLDAIRAINEKEGDRIQRRRSCVDEYIKEHPDYSPTVKDAAKEDESQKEDKLGNEETKKEN